MSWFSKITGHSSTEKVRYKVVKREAPLSNPFIINSPKLGILNLLGEEGNVLAEEDRSGLAQLFAGCISSQEKPPICDVLLIYCTIKNNGELNGTKDTLKKIIYESHAPIVIVASPNPGNAYIAAVKRPGKGKANLVMVLDRKGSNFVRFHRSLFDRMSHGKTMPIAWVELAPQISGGEQDNNPDTIFACDAGHIMFNQAEGVHHD